MVADIQETILKVKENLSKLTGLKCQGVIGVNQEGDELIITLEMLEKTRIPDSMDILGIYEIKIDSQGGIKDFTRLRLRNRGDTQAG